MSRIQTQDADLIEENNVFDFQIDSEGDILTKDFFDTSLLMSVFCEKRASASEMPASHLRRGWIGNIETPDFEIGSKLWLSYQAKKTNDTLNDINTALNDALKWLIDDGYAIDYSVSSSFASNGVNAAIDITRSNSKVEKRLFELWSNTGL